MAIGSSVKGLVTQMSSTSASPPEICIDLGQGAMAAFLSGDRLHLQHGPINLIIRAYGLPASVAECYEKVIGEFPSLLNGLVTDLTVLRQPISKLSGESQIAVEDVTAKRMTAAVSAYASEFLTPMAAVAGAVADQVIDWVRPVVGIDRCFVNNGGDIAVYLADGQSMDIGVVPSLVDAVANAKISLNASANIGGVATSGWNGHSYSFGIADAVTVLARSAAEADVAATMIANNVDVDHTSIQRRPASELDGATDLGERIVTVSVGTLPEQARESALTQGANYAENLLSRGLISSALISLQGSWRMVGDVSSVSTLALR